VESLRILIVDDLEDNGVLLCDALQMRGFEARYAPDGATALALAPDFAPHIAILDVLMPEMDGYELGRRLRALPGHEKICLIAISGFDRDAGAARAAGFHGHVMKPMTLDRVEQAVRAGYAAATR
jgi:CheY-like chemotaxis protein